MQNGEKDTFWVLNEDDYVKCNKMAKFITF